VMMMRKRNELFSTLFLIKTRQQLFRIQLAGSRRPNKQYE
jgi:hypothetical protein